MCTPHTVSIHERTSFCLQTFVLALSTSKSLFTFCFRARVNIVHYQCISQPSLVLTSQFILFEKVRVVASYVTEPSPDDEEGVREFSMISEGSDSKEKIGLGVEPVTQLFSSRSVHSCLQMSLESYCCCFSFERFALLDPRCHTKNGWLTDASAQSNLITCTAMVQKLLRKSSFSRR